MLNGYLFLNILVGWNVLEAERNGTKVPYWVKPLIYLSIPWAFAIHTVTAFLYCGFAGRGFWLTAVMAPRFLASAFSSGPAFLILLCFLIRRVSTFDMGQEPIQALARIATYWPTCFSCFAKYSWSFTAAYRNTWRILNISIPG